MEGGRAWRTGLIVAARRRMTTASLRSGGVVSRDGCRVGVDVATGHPAAVSWREAEGGVLCADPAETAARPADDGLAESGFTMAHAAIRRRKPVIVIDLTGSRGWPRRWPPGAWSRARRCTASARPGRDTTSRCAAAIRPAPPRWSWP